MDLLITFTNSLWEGDLYERMLGWKVVVYKNLQLSESNTVFRRNTELWLYVLLYLFETKEIGDNSGNFDCLVIIIITDG